jgi:hypothetical protein
MIRATARPNASTHGAGAGTFVEAVQAGRVWRRNATLRTAD